MLNLNTKVYKYLQSIPKGKVVTYGQIAEDLGNKNLSRVIGNILHINPDPIKYPCYKVVNYKGELSKNFGDGGINIQKERLEKDGIIVNNYKVDLKIYQYKKPSKNYLIENYFENKIKNQNII
jgi:O-6-methylguanine DNA methyltransferase